MTVVGVLLILVAVLLLVAVLFGGSGQEVTLDLGLFDVTTSTLGVFLIGAATVLVFVSGLELLRSGLRRTIRKRRELKHARAVVAGHDRREPTPAPTADSDPTSASGESNPPPER